MTNPLEWKDNKLSYNPKELMENIPYCVLTDNSIVVIIKKNETIRSYYIKENEK